MKSLMVAWAIILLGVLALLAYEYEHRQPASPNIEMSLPKSINEMQTPPDYQPVPNNLPDGGKG
jgi:hypothetical protein